MTEDAPGPAGTDYITAEQIAAELGVHPQTAQRYFREGGLPGRKIGKSWTTTRAAFTEWLTGPSRPAPLERGGMTLERK